MPKLKYDKNGLPKGKITSYLSISGIKASRTDRDDLKEISGVGPFIEKKLNALGIYTFEQVKGLNKKDIKMVTDAIKFFPGRIERDKWVGQSRKLFKQYYK